MENGSSSFPINMEEDRQISYEATVFIHVPHDILHKSSIYTYIFCDRVDSPM